MDEELRRIVKEREEHKAAEDAEFEENLRIINSIEGLYEILDQRAAKAIVDWHDRHHIPLSNDYEYGDLVYGRRPQYDFEAAYKKYPRAAAYIKCKEVARKRNQDLAQIGEKALHEVIYGDYRKALEMLETETHDYYMHHAFDRYTWI